MSAPGNPIEEEREHVTEDQLGGEGATARERDQGLQRNTRQGSRAVHRRHGDRPFIRTPAAGDCAQGRISTTSC